MVENPLRDRALQFLGVSVLVATLSGCGAGPQLARPRTPCERAADRVSFPEGAWTTKLLDQSLGEYFSMQQQATRAACRGDVYRRRVSLSVRHLGGLEPLGAAGLETGTSWEERRREGRWTSGVIDFDRVEALARLPEVLEIRFEPRAEPDS